jgi:hypothetical protein
MCLFRDGSMGLGVAFHRIQGRIQHKALGGAIMCGQLVGGRSRTLVCLQAHPASAHAPKCVGWPLDVVWIVLCLCSHCRGFSDRPCSCGLDVGLQLLRQCTLTRGPSHHGVHCLSQPSWLAANSYCLNCKQLLPTILLEGDISQV